MYKRDGSLIVSATDLAGYLACEHLATLELEAASGLRQRPVRRDPELDLIQERGEEHEGAVLSRHRGANRRVVDLSELPGKTVADLRTAEQATLEAMRSAADVIYQGTFFDGRWRGHPDFLTRVERPSALGAWSYEVEDAKLARRVKATAVIQVCSYSARLSELQGQEPEHASVITGDGEAHRHRLGDYTAYFRSIRRRFEERLFCQTGPVETYPDPVEHCRVCRWYPVCADKRCADDHLCRVAGMTRAYTKKLTTAGLGTLTALGRSPGGIGVAEMAQKPLDRLRNQARLQLEQYRDGRVRHELIEPDKDEPGKGLAALPQPSPLDLFFDIESHPWVFEDGLEYLLGAVFEESGKPVFHPLWAHDRAGEKKAFEDSSPRP